MVNEEEEEETTSLGPRVVESRSRRISRSLGQVLPRPDLVFMCQMILIYIVVAVSLFNLSCVTTDVNEEKLWVVLLASCLGYMLPNPKLDIRPKTQP